MTDTPTPRQEAPGAVVSAPQGPGGPGLAPQGPQAVQEAVSDSREPHTHDYGPGRRYWGHDYTIAKVRDGGQRLRGWGHDGAAIREGDYLLLTAPDGQRTSRYQVAKIQHLVDPDDMWHVDLAFAPRTYSSQAEKDATR